MLNVKNALKALMVKHRGKQNAIKRRDILHELGLLEKDDRNLREQIAELRREGFPVMFSTSRPQGYFLPDDITELNGCLDNLRSYIKAECIILRDLKVKGRMFVESEYQGILL